MNKSELKNKAEYGMRVPCFVITVRDTNPLSDREIVDNISVHFDKWFGKNTPWCIFVERIATANERFVALYQPAQKKIAVTSKTLFYNRTGDIDDATIAIAVATARACCMIPLPQIKPVEQEDKTPLHEESEPESTSTPIVEIPTLTPVFLPQVEVALESVKQFRLNEKLDNRTLATYAALLAEC
jgi:hypothetical protein